MAFGGLSDLNCQPLTVEPASRLVDGVNSLSAVISLGRIRLKQLESESSCPRSRVAPGVFSYPAGDLLGVDESLCGGCDHECVRARPAGGDAYRVTTGFLPADMRKSGQRPRLATAVEWYAGEAQPPAPDGEAFR